MWGNQGDAQVMGHQGPKQWGWVSGSGGGPQAVGAGLGQWGRVPQPSPCHGAPSALLCGPLGVGCAEAVLGGTLDISMKQ